MRPPFPLVLPLLALAVWPGVARAEPGDLAVTPAGGSGAVFAGRATDVRLRVDAKRAVNGRLLWRFSAGDRTIAAREAAFEAGPGKPALVTARLEAPPVKPGVALAARLTVSADAGAGVTAAFAADIWVLPEDPFADRTEWLKSLKITLFDPPGHTAKALTGLNVPFVEQPNPAALPEITEGVVVVGEGVSFKEHRDVPAALARLAARGVAVLCLAPADGEVTVPGLADAPADQAELFLRRDAGRHLDKRLAPAGWPGDGLPVAATLGVKAGDAGPVGEVGATPGGWPWAEARFAGRGRWAFCGYGTVSNWGDGPAPRYLFARALEHLTADPEKKPEKP